MSHLSICGIRCQVEQFKSNLYRKQEIAVLLAIIIREI